ncbi:4-phosphoerythronate dehydrogenase [Pseudoalteromonas luteoviolacea]|uniref:4-phosphoerythronate dehydrogenase n=1 Tax=Pseudoalteromonas luteoviolacea TaxID=43657 RepID=UPI001B36849B|nr:4-phosphoerythronate dehydrogenase [Pseudoalteromonas luteoviolacea]MBQ4814500.1 4-phosphoerythronate dehydrogenase [Pseudoalteromonas luteoviolacea]
MKILADQNMPLVEEFFSSLGRVERYDGRTVTAEQVQAADVLLTRSITQVNANLLAQAHNLKFVGTATIGVDHIDQTYLSERGIAFSSAPGCNAIAVAEYVISALYAYSQDRDVLLRGKKLAIVGVGNIGKCLAQKLKYSGIELILCDPVRAQEGTLDEHVDIDTALAEADFVTFHVPLVKSGEHQTKHLLNEKRIKALKPGMLIINASRGDVIDNQALLQAKQSKQQLELVLDVWENEPAILTALMDECLYTSVHIAGHTLEGKARGTQMLYEALCKTLKLAPTKQLEAFLPIPVIGHCSLNETLDETDYGRIVHMIYDIRRDNGLMRANLESQGFDVLRKQYPVRREFSTLSVSAPQAHQQKLQQLGFRIEQNEE